MTTGEGTARREPPKGAAARDAVIEATLRLAERRAFEDVTIADIAHEAGVSLADFRDLFPSKGAVLGGFLRKIDRKVLDGVDGAGADGAARDRLFEVLRRRLDALEPYRDSMASIARWTRRDPMVAAALNREVVNSMRFMLEAADIDSDGPVGALKLQGLTLGWGRVLDAWFEHGDMADALDELDRVLERGEKYVGHAENLARATAPLRSFAHGLLNTALGRRGKGDDEPYPHAEA